MTAINNETTELIVKLDSSGDISEDDSSSNALSTKNSFDSLRASARSFADALSESMQRIGFLGSTSIAVNSLTGPAMLCLPDTYQRSGLIPTTGTTIDATTNFGRFSIFRLLSGGCLHIFGLFSLSLLALHSPSSPSLISSSQSHTSSVDRILNLQLPSCLSAYYRLFAAYICRIQFPRSPTITLSA